MLIQIYREPKKAAAPLGLAMSAAALFAAPLWAQRPGPFAVTETGARFHRLQDAVDSLAGGDGTIEIAPGTYGDCAVHEAGRVAFVAKMRGTVIFKGGICEGKATLVLRGRAAHVEGMTFTGTFVDDGNGAGIRIEKGNLTVGSTVFVNAQSGIVSSNDDRSSTISIDRSTFAGLGKHPDGNGTHSIYVGRYGGLQSYQQPVRTGNGWSLFEEPGASHRGSRQQLRRQPRPRHQLHDRRAGGAVGRIAGNTFVNGADKENYGTMIAVAAESRRQPSAGLTIEHNRAWLVPSFPWSTTFVGSWTKEPLVIRDNALGSGIRAFKQR